MTGVQLAAFHPVEAVECVEVTKTIPGRGVWLVQLHQRTSTGLERLQMAFVRPPPAVASGASCTSEYDAIPAIALINSSGAAVVPAGLRDGCGHLATALKATVKAMHWQTDKVQLIRQETTPQALEAHCQQQWENENADDGSDRQASTGGPVTTRTFALLRVCIYAGPGQADTTTNDTVGTFQRGFTLSRLNARRFLAALTGPGPNSPCPVEPTFAVVNLGASYVNVELGGCWRVARDGDNPETTGAANATVIASLLRQA